MLTYFGGRSGLKADVKDTSSDISFVREPTKVIMFWTLSLSVLSIPSLTPNSISTFSPRAFAFCGLAYSTPCYPLRQFKSKSF